MTEDPYESQEYEKFVQGMARHCHCKESNRPCDGILAGGVCDGITEDEEDDDDEPMEDE